jgi:hypothetical protein
MGQCQCQWLTVFHFHEHLAPLVSDHDPPPNGDVEFCARFLMSFRERTNERDSISFLAKDGQHFMKGGLVGIGLKRVDGNVVMCTCTMITSVQRRLGLLWNTEARWYDRLTDIGKEQAQALMDSGFVEHVRDVLNRGRIVDFQQLEEDLNAMDKRQASVLAKPLDKGAASKTI